MMIIGPRLLSPERMVALSLTLCAALLLLRAEDLPAPRSDLRPVPVPDLSRLEEAVGTQLEEALGKLREAVAATGGTDTQLGEAYGLTARFFQSYELNDSAEACYLNAAVLQPTNFAWVYLLGRLYHTGGKLDQARTWYLRAKSLRGDYPALFVNAGNLMLQLNEPELAEQAFKGALVLSPSDPSGHAGLGEVYLLQKQYVAAVTEFESAVRSVPQANRIHYLLAMAYRGMGDQEKARAHMGQMGPVGIKPTDPLFDGLQELRVGERAFLLQGRRAYSAGDFSEAVRLFGEAVEAEPDSARARINLGSALAQTGDVEGAITQYSEALRIQPDNTTALFNIASLYSMIGRLEEAASHFEKVITAKPDDAEAHLSLAGVLARSNRAESAQEHYSRAIELQPSNEDAILGKVELLLTEMRYKEALSLLEDSYRQLPRQGRIVHALAKMLSACPEEDLRDGPRAVELATKAFEALPTFTHAETVALAMGQVGRCPEAGEWLARAADLAREQGRPDRAQAYRKKLELIRAGAGCRP